MTKRTEKQAEILAGLTEFRLVQAVNPALVACDQIVSALGQFMECVRYLNTRRSKGAKLNLENEADVQDALYLMLRPWVLDLVYENPTDKVGNRYAIKIVRYRIDAIVQSFHRLEQWGIWLIPISDDSFVGVTIGRIRARLGWIIIAIFEPMPAHTDFGFKQSQREILVKKSAVRL